MVIKEVFLSRLSVSARAEALKEAEQLRQLHHSNIVAYVEHFEVNSALYIVTEYAEGGTLASFITAQSDTPIDESTILRYFVQMAQALDYLHSKRIIHRDIKSANVFLTRAGDVKVGDLGLSVVTSGTHSGTICGTASYLAPEMCRGKVRSQD